MPIIVEVTISITLNQSGINQEYFLFISLSLVFREYIVTSCISGISVANLANS